MELLEKVARIIGDSVGPLDAARKITELPEIQFGQELRKRCYIGEGPDGITVSQRTR